MDHVRRGQPLSGAVAAVLAGFSGTSFAQNLDEIVVTAERRETSLQETPISIAAFSAETMELKGLETLEDVAAFTPNLDIKGARFSGNVSPTYQIRGLSGGGGAAGERATALYIDGVFMPRTTGPFMSVLDIERIEVLRGPQGTLFGRNSTGGAIRVFTKQPGPEQDAYVRVSAGSFSRADLSGMINVPLSDSVFLRAHGGSLSQDGYVTRGSQELGGSEDKIGRLQVAFEPSETFRISVGLSRADTESDGNPQDIETFDMNPNLNFEGQRADWLSDFLEAAGQAPLDANNDSRIVLDDFTLPGWCFVDDGDPDWDPACEVVNNSEYSQLDVHVGWQINDTWSLTSTTGLSDFESAGLVDSVLLNTRVEPTNVKSDVTYQEVQLNASFGDGRFELVTGFSYFQEDSSSFGALLERRGTSIYTPGGGVANLNGVAVGSGPAGLFRTGDTIFAQDATSYGLFANVTWSITDRLALTPGVRFAWDEKRISDTEFASNDFVPAPNTTSTTVTPENEWDDVDYRLTADYDITDNHMVYATASKAFRAGAYSYTIGDNTTGAVQMAAFAAGVTDPFVDPESVENAEVGMRTEWLDGRLRVNLTYFDMTYSDRQAPVQVLDPSTPVGFRIVIQNTGDVDLDGFELEGEIAATDNVTIDFSAGLVDSHIADVCANNGDFLFPGPVEDSYSLGGRWRMPLQSGSDLTFSLAYAWTCKQQTHPGGTAFTPCFTVTGAPNAAPSFFFDSRYELPDYGLLNARVRYTGGGGKWDLTLFGNNLTDEVYSNYASRAGGGFWDGVNMAGVGAPLRSMRGATRGRPREYGVTFQYNFGGVARRAQ
jgi:iron complex outermembrane receptor protein